MTQPLLDQHHRVGVPSARRRQPRTLRAETVLAAIAFGAVLCVLWPLALAVAAPQPLGLVPLIAHLAGMTAGYGVIVLVALMSRTSTYSS